MTKRLFVAALVAAFAPQAGFVQRGIVAVRAEERDVKALIGDVNKAFADYRTANDQELAELKKNGVVSSDTKAKVETIGKDISDLQASIDELNVKLAAAQMGGAGKTLKDPEYSDAFRAHFKKGDVNAALNKGTDADGGYLAPVEWDRTVTNKLVLISPMRQICKVQPTSKAGFTKLFNLRGTTSGWVGETDARPQTNGPTLAALAFGSGEIYANPAATQQLLDDGEIDVEGWLSGEVDTEFARQEGSAFVAGDGTNKPSGILTFATGGANAAKHPLGAIGVLSSGAAAAITSDAVYDVIYDLPSIYTGNARFTMNRNTQGSIRKLKDGQGNYLWQPSYAAGQPATLAGYPITEIPDMPDVAANALPLLFGDFMQSYMIIDRIGIRVLRDPYTNKPYVMFYTTKRVGGGLLNPEPMRALKIAAAA